VLTREPDLISEVQTIGNFGETDHEMMQWDIVMQTEQEQKTFSSVRDYNRADFDKIRGQLQNINWDELLDRDTVEEAWDSFKQLL